MAPLSRAAEDLALALAQEAVELGLASAVPSRRAVLDGIAANHHPEDIEDAARGGVAALLRTRAAFGLPTFR